MLVAKLKEITTTFNQPYPNEEDHKYHFNYGKSHWQNLQDLEDDCDKVFSERNKYILLLWKDNDKKLNEFGALLSTEYVGEIYYVVRSRIDESDYNFKYETHIKNLEAETEKLMNSLIDCNGWMVTRWKEIEIENAYDTNLDGLKIQFTIIKHE